MNNGKTTNDYDPVVQIQNRSGSLCTATAIRDDVLLTSAHCLARRDGSVTEFTTVISAHGTNSSAKGARSGYFLFSQILFRDARRLFKNTGYLDMSRDIALIKFGSGTFRSFYPIGSANKDIQTHKVTILGFGTEQSKDVITNAPILKFRPSQLEYAQIETDKDKVFLEPGDSGGPVFFTHHGILYVIGVNTHKGAVNYHSLVTPKLHRFLSDALKALSENCADLYEKKGFQGRSWALCYVSGIQKALDQHSFRDRWKCKSDGLKGDWNNKFSSLTIPTSTILTIYEDPGYSGRSHTFHTVYLFGKTRKIDNLQRYGLHKKVSSFHLTRDHAPSHRIWHIANTQSHVCLANSFVQTNHSRQGDSLLCDKKNDHQRIIIIQQDRGILLQNWLSKKYLQVFENANGMKRLAFGTCEKKCSSNLFAFQTNTKSVDKRDFSIHHMASNLCVEFVKGHMRAKAYFWLKPCHMENKHQRFALKMF